jgi:ABC-2 type transport system ATP-binding protein
MLSVSHVTKYYDKFRAVNDVSFDIKEGEIFGLLGVNGAGKTTTFRMIMGLLDKTEGSITLDGKEIDYSVTDKIGFLTEERSLLPNKTVLEQAIFYCALKGMDNSTIIDRLDKYLEEFKISEYKHKKIKELSKGNQQKIQFIAAVINDPVLLILDEPFTGLDPINVEMFKKHIRMLQKKGCSIIFSSHQMEHIEEFCEKMVLLVKGKSILEGYVKDIKKDYRKQNIFIKGNVNIDEIKKIKGVISIEKKTDEIEVKIESYDIVEKVFKVISKYNIDKFLVQEATLNEIFISKVGELK